MKVLVRLRHASAWETLAEWGLRRSTATEWTTCYTLVMQAASTCCDPHTLVDGIEEVEEEEEEEECFMSLGC